VRGPGDQFALDVVAWQVAAGDEVLVVLLEAAAGTPVPAGAQSLPMPPLQYDGLVELLTWCERVVSW
ncbi:MAG: hypothetical protein QOK05_908, partial [Chloroflexota bacterium]|jgi:hypothetical protein|nr:hypothetical protein [Chloroflexota bacterium]